MSTNPTYDKDEIKEEKSDHEFAKAFIYDATSFVFAPHIQGGKRSTEASQLLSKKCEFYKITFFIPQNPNNYILEYKDKYNKWHCKKRVIDKYGPITSDSYE